MFSSVRFKNTDFHRVPHSTKAVTHWPLLDYSPSHPLICNTQTCLWQLSADWFLALLWTTTNGPYFERGHWLSWSTSSVLALPLLWHAAIQGFQSSCWKESSWYRVLQDHLLACGRKKNHGLSCGGKTYCLLCHCLVTGDWTQHR